MALNSVSTAVGQLIPDLPSTETAALAAVLTELQSLKITVVAGTTAVTNIPVALIDSLDTFVSVIRFHSGTPSDVTSQTSVTSTGNIQLATTDTTGDVLLVVWFDKD